MENEVEPTQKALPPLSEENLIYFQKMLRDNAFKKMIDQHTLLESIIVPFFLLFQDYEGKNYSDQTMKRIAEMSYSISQTVLKVWDDFSDSFYPIIELGICLPDQNEKEE